MIIQYIDKPLDEMSVEELRLERFVQTWIKERVRRERRDLAYNIEKKEEYIKEKLPTWNEIDLLQSRGEITKEEARHFRISRSRRENQLTKWEDRLIFADMWLLHMNAYLAKIDEKIENKTYVKEIKHRTRKRKKNSVHKGVQSREKSVSEH